MSLESVKNKISQKTINGIGKKTGSLSQQGVFSKNGVELFEVNFYDEIDGTVVIKENSTNTISEDKFSITTGKNHTKIDLEIYDSAILLHDDSVLPIEVEEISTSINEHGKIYKMWLDAKMGVKILVGGELYAVIDYMQNPAQIRENPDFSQNLSEEQKDFVASVMLAVFNWAMSFKTTDQTPSKTTSIGI